MLGDESLVFEFTTRHGQYQIVDMIYDGRPARVLFSGNRQAAQSGMATDSLPDLLFDYNQRMFELVSAVQPKRLLLIGGGMYTLPMALLAAFPQLSVDVVEIDAELAPIAETYFGLQPSPRLRTIASDGLAYLASNQQLYDVVLIDAYTHATAEPTLATDHAAQLVRAALTDNGVVAINSIAAYYGQRSQALQRLLTAYRTHFASVLAIPASRDLSLWLPQNLLIVADTQANSEVAYSLRNPPLEQLLPANLRRDFGII